VKTNPRSLLRVIKCHKALDVCLFFGTADLSQMTIRFIAERLAVFPCDLVVKKLIATVPMLY